MMIGGIITAGFILLYIHWDDNRKLNRRIDHLERLLEEHGYDTTRLY